VKKHNYFNLKNMSLALCAIVFSFFLSSLIVQNKVWAEAKCAILGQGLVACPTSADGKSSLGAGTENCYYYDPGAPRAGEDPTYPGWRTSTCNSDVYKSAAAISPELRAVPDKALNCSSGTSDCGIMDSINNFVNFLSALVGVVAVLSLIFAAMQYGSSQDDPAKVNAAKSRITATIVALISYFLLYAFLQWLIPGGLLNGL
jgi:hypothetical protein